MHSGIGPSVLRGGSGVGAAMAIVASELYARVIRPNQVSLQVEIVIEFDAAGIARAFPHGGKLRVAAAKAVDGVRELWRSFCGSKIGMALRANGICRGRESKCAFVLDVAGTARRCKHLAGLVGRRVMAGEASLVRHVLEVAARLPQVA